MKIIVQKFGCFKNFLLYLETLLHITRLVFVIRKKLMSESSHNSKQILLDGQNGSPNSKQHQMELFFSSVHTNSFSDKNELSTTLYTTLLEKHKCVAYQEVR